MNQEECLFCQIINRQVPSDIIYEDDYTLAFLDINPVNPGHALVIPKKHSQNILDTDEETLSHLSATTKKVAMAILKALDYPAFNLMANNGQVAGQVIFHTHWHIVPRSTDDGLKLWPGKPYQEGQAQEIAQKIIEQLDS